MKLNFNVSGTHVGIFPFVLELVQTLDVLGHVCLVSRSGEDSRCVELILRGYYNRIRFSWCKVL